MLRAPDYACEIELGRCFACGLRSEPGVYSFWIGKECVYVGRSGNVRKRTTKNDYILDAFIRGIPPTRLEVWYGTSDPKESDAIYELSPTWNRQGYKLAMNPPKDLAARKARKAEAVRFRRRKTRIFSYMACSPCRSIPAAKPRASVNSAKSQELIFTGKD